MKPLSVKFTPASRISYSMALFLLRNSEEIAEIVAIYTNGRRNLLRFENRKVMRRLVRCAVASLTGSPVRDDATWI